MKYDLGDIIADDTGYIKGTIVRIRNDDKKAPYDIKCTDGLVRPANDTYHLIEPASHEHDNRTIYIKDPCKPSWPCNEGRYCQVCGEGRFSKSDLLTMLESHKAGRSPRPTEITRLLEQLIEVTE